MRILGIAGWSGSGKTTLIEKLIPALVARGVSVSTVKHAHHAFDIDLPGKDSWRHRQAGAREVLIASNARFALLHENLTATEPDLFVLLRRLAPVDLVLVEGFKRTKIAYLEVWRAGSGKPRLPLDMHQPIAIVSDSLPGVTDVPALPLDDPATVSDFILKWLAAGE